jgi:putative nucleotidyltransferase-like protein
METPEAPFEAIRETVKKAAGALREAEIPFVLAGGLASWARGGPETEHDLDLLVKPEDAERTLDTLTAAGMKPEKPPENWLYKAWDGDVMVDVIFDPEGGPVDDELIERSDELEVEAVRMRVLTATDILITKLLAFKEHEVDYDSVVEVARSLREQIEWARLREGTKHSAYARAFFTLVEGLGIAEPA